MRQAGAPGKPRPRRIGRMLAWVAASLASVATAAFLFRPPAVPAPQRFDEASGRGAPSVPPSEGALEVGHETRDMSGKLMMWLTVGLGGSVAGMIGLMLLLTGFFHQERRDIPAHLTAEQTAPLHPPRPNLQVAPVADLAHLHAAEENLLQHYAWIDSGHVHARIPIRRAMTLMVGRTLGSAP